MIDISGVYTITNILNNMIYVGCSKHVNHRIGQHFRELKRGVHSNNRLQNAVIKYGIKFFKFELLEECGVEYMYSLENYWCNMLDSHNRKNGYNLKPTCPNNRPGNSKETNIKIGILKKGNKNCVGRILSEETLIKISQSNSKHTYLQYSLEGIFIKEFSSYQLRKEKFDLGNIHKCCKNKVASHRKFIWRFKDEKDIPLKICNLHYLDKNKHRGGIKKGGFQKSSWKKVLKICPNSFKILGIFDTPSMIEKENNYSTSTISKCCLKNKNIAEFEKLCKSQNFIWVYENENNINQKNTTNVR